MKSGVIWFWFWFLSLVFLAVINGIFASEGRLANLVAMACASAAAGFQLRDGFK